MPIKYADVFVPIKPDMEGFDRDVQKGSVAAGGKASKSFGDTFRQSLGGGDFGRFVKGGLGLGVGLGAAGLLAGGVGKLAGAISGAVDEAADFEEQLGIINTVAKLSDDALRDLGDGIQGIAEEQGKSTDELTQAAYNLVSAGVPAADILDVLRDSATLSTAALSSTDEAVDLITTTLNAFKLEASDSSSVMDVWAKTVANGKVTASQLASSIAQVAPIAAAASVSVEEVAAAYATMTAQGTPASQAATQMRAAITALLKPNAQLVELQRTLNGQTFEQILREEGLAAALGAVSDAAGGKTDRITAALGSTEAYNGALQLTGESAGAFKKNLDAMRTAAEKGGDAVGMAAERTDTLRRKQDRFAAKQLTLSQDLGEMVLPFMEGVTELGIGVLDTIRGMAEGIGDIVDAANDFLDPSRKLREELEAMEKADPSLEGLAAWFDQRAEAQRMAEAIAAIDGNIRLLGLSASEVTNLELVLAGFGDKVGDVDLVTATASDTFANWAGTLDLLDPDARADALNSMYVVLAQQLGITTDLEGAQGQLNDETSESIRLVKEFLAQPEVAERHAQEARAAMAAGQAAMWKAQQTTAAVEDEQRSILRFASEFDEIPASLRDSIRSGKDEVRDAMADLRWAIEHPMKGIKHVAWLEGQLTSRDLKRGLRSGKAGIRAEAERARAVLIEEWERATGKAWDYGLSINKNLARGQRKNRGKAKGAAGDTADAVGAELEGAATAAEGYGKFVTTSFARGLTAEQVVGLLANALNTVADKVADFLQLGSPAKEGPMSKAGGPEGWGRRVGKQFSDGLAETKAMVGEGMAAALSVAAPAAAFAGAGAAGPVAVGPSSVDMHVTHDFAPGTARELRDEGYDDAGIAALLNEAEATASLRRSH